MAGGAQDLLFGGAIGIAVWELAKQVFSAVLKRRGDSGAEKRKVLRDELAKASALVGTCLETAITYYTIECDAARRSELSRTVRHQMQLLSGSTHRINIGVQAAGQPGLDVALIIAFRKATTMGLDDASFVAVSDEHHSVLGIYRAAHQLQIALAQATYAAT